MSFKRLTSKEFDALTEDQQKYYLEQLETVKAKELQEKIDAAVKAAVDAEKETNEKAVAEKVEAAVKVVKDEFDLKLEQAEAGMKRIKEERNKERADSLSDSVLKALGEEDSQKSWNEMRAGGKTGILSNFEMKAPAASMPFPVAANRDEWAADVEIPSEPIHVRNIVPVTTTNANAIKYIQWAYGEDGNLITYVTQGNEKPQFELIPTVEVANVVKIAGHITVNDELFEDMESARASIARQLPQALYDVEDAQILRLGTGGTTQLNSIWDKATAWAATGSVNAGSNVWDKLVSGQTMVARAKGRATAAWVSPEAYQELLINKNDNGTYNYPIVMGNDNILRVGNIPVFYHNAFGVAEGILGDFYGATELFQKKGVEVRYSREHDKNFTENKTTVLIEVREAFAVYKPYSFVKFDNLVLPTS